MKHLALATLLWLALPAWAQLPVPGTPGAPTDKRYCGEPPRHADGTIKRSDAPRRQYVAEVPCPTTGQRVTSCPGFHLDHTWPMAAGGCDSRENLSWLDVRIKQCRKDAPQNKDCWELRVYRAATRPP